MAGPGLQACDQEVNNVPISRLCCVIVIGTQSLKFLSPSSGKLTHFCYNEAFPQRYLGLRFDQPGDALAMTHSAYLCSFFLEQKWGSDTLRVDTIVPCNITVTDHATCDWKEGFAAKTRHATKGGSLPMAVFTR